MDESFFIKSNQLETVAHISCPLLCTSVPNVCCNDFHFKCEWSSCQKLKALWKVCSCGILQKVMMISIWCSIIGVLQSKSLPEAQSLELISQLGFSLSRIMIWKEPVTSDASTTNRNLHYFLLLPRVFNWTKNQKTKLWPNCFLTWFPGMEQSSGSWWSSPYHLFLKFLNRRRYRPW